ncbi:hypothetical protein BU24DRAFT_420552 [Aaosphaeria arxii CBS 175.79]|uniref:Uncharacterized protein n=1 Tax=Aaosphaeria arxii CBS 175.79 TaxID=1450172 RepID=A0A6A5XZ12_9PLEO|nr:uncharacterized protein BU24DRAFT_420552 [Aaosphaeria arxii CBS 175.79]KAF2017524.1 hypothetical protein BU24DRAFT_420552 [Aaosphaeria arxii CBS 175.79]
MTDPEQLLRRPGKARRPKPSHEAVLAGATFTNPKDASSNDVADVYDIGTGVIPSVEDTLERHLPVKAPQPENKGTTPDRILVAPKMSDDQSQEKVPPQQYWPPPLVSPESTHDSHARGGGAPTEVEHNDSSNDNCVIRFAEHDDSPAGQMRQVKSERQGIFKEDMVVMGCRFFVRG